MLKILLSNDDGIESEGIKILYKYLKNISKVFVIAPEENQSGAGSSISTRKPLSVNKKKNGFFAVNGTPGDCVYLGLNGVCPFEPDLVITGINYGANLAEDLVYSGTVGAAFEGKHLSLPSLAVSASVFSQHGSEENKLEPNFETAAMVTKEIILNIHNLEISSSVVLNINVPNLPYHEIKGKSVTVLGSWGKRNPPFKEINSKGQERFWITHRDNIPINSKDTDIAALLEGRVSISPIFPNFYVKERSDELSEWVNTLQKDEKI